MTKKILYCGNSDYIVTHYVMGTHAQTMGRTADTSKHLKRALETDPSNEVTHIHGGSVMEDFPSSYEELNQYDLLLLSDIAADALLMYFPTINDAPLPYGPNRLQLIKDCVENGMGFIMNGAYCSYSGYMGMGHYHRTPVEDILPVIIAPYDDHVEVPQGFHLLPHVTDHPITAGIPWDEEAFLLIGYNRVEAKPGYPVLAEYDGDPMMVVGEYGKGRTLSYMPGATPHWGGDFYQWEYYPKFWTQVVDWFSRRK